jgi:aryl-alcohol dehydrogenase-like predicted oxidoreductase
MRYVTLDDVPPISKIGLGTWQFGSREWGYGHSYATDTARAIVHRAVDLGITLFDTAELYAFGRSERILGEALDGRRKDAFVATKLFPELPLGPIVEWRAIASAHRLGVDLIDLYQVHQPNPLVPDAATMRGMRRLQDSGFIGEVGVSNYSLARWRHAEATLGRRVLSNQVNYSLVARRPERDLIGYAESMQRLVIAYSPLAQGLLTGRYDPHHLPCGAVRAANPLFLPENLKRASALIATLREVAAAHDATPAQVALAWVIRSPNVVAIPGASTIAQLESNAAAADLMLSTGEVAALSAAAEAFTPIRGAAALRELAGTWWRRSRP